MANYVEKKELLNEIIKSQQQDRMTERLAELCMEIGKRLLYHKSFVGYHSNLKEEMYSEGCLYCVRYLLKKFDRNKNSSPFAFVTCIFWSAYINTLKKYYRTIENEKKLIDMLACSISDEEIRMLEEMDIDNED